LDEEQHQQAADEVMKLITIFSSLLNGAMLTGSVTHNFRHFR